MSTPDPAYLDHGYHDKAAANALDLVKQEVKEKMPMPVKSVLSEPGVNESVIDKNGWLWQRRPDKWQCVTQGVGGPPTREWSQLVEFYGPLVSVVLS